MRIQVASVFVAIAAIASSAPAQTTRAVEASPPRVPGAPKQLYYEVNFFYPTWRGRLPPGFLPAISESGGRFVMRGGKVDSYFAGGYNGPCEDLILDKVRAAMVDLPPGTLYVFDQERETWRTDVRYVTPAVAEHNKRRFRQFSDTVRAANPLLRVAIYGVLPDRNYWVTRRQYDAARVYDLWKAGATLNADQAWSISHAYSWDGNAWVLSDTIGGNEGRAQYLQWRAAGDADIVGMKDDGTVDPNAGLDDAVDVLTPSLYDFYAGDDTEGYVAEMIAEARRIGGGRKVYPFVWPEYHDSNAADGGKTIPIDEWRAHVRRILRQADGCVLWNADPVRHREHIRVLQEEAELASREPPTTQPLTPH